MVDVICNLLILITKDRQLPLFDPNIERMHISPYSKLLIIRFSSIGDVTQALSIPGLIHESVPTAKIHFITRAEFSQLVQTHPNLEKVFSLERKDGFSGLLKMIRELRKEKYTHIYDAHNNLRSFLIRFLILGPKKLVRPMHRWKRFLLLNFHIDLFEKPFSGQRDLLKPLEKWGIPFRLPAIPQLTIDEFHQKKVEPLLIEHKLYKTNFVVLAPSATYELKRWPIDYWKKLIEHHPETQFVVLAGPSDQFTHALDEYRNVVNLTGQTSLLESAAIIEKAKVVVANDTGLLHFAEQLGRPALALMGPAPFGFPSRPKTTILEKNLKCRPCSKHGQGPCVNKNYQQCLRDISPEIVSMELKKKL